MSFKDTEIGRIPFEWEVCELKDKVEITMGQSPKSEFYNDKGEGIPFMQGRATFGEKYHYIDTWCTQPKKYAEKNDVLMSVRAPVGDVNIATTDLCIGRGLASLRMRNKNNEYLYYLLKNFTSVFTSRESGTVFGSINKSGIESVKLPFPNEYEQKAIAKILSDLDKKIETNNKINKKLEEMAQAIFKKWFVDFEFPNEDGKPYKSSGGEMVEGELGMIPKGWEVVKLKDIGNLTMGLSPKSESYNAIGEGTPLLNGAADFYGGLIKATKYTTKETRVCKKNDLVFCIRATIGNITFADKEYCLGRGVASIESKKNLYVGIIYMNLSRSIERLKAQATGSVILGLSKPDINDMKLILPTKEILNKYSDIFKNAFDKKHILELENDKLINLRDTLLPKLMSGEIRVPLV